MRLEGVVMNNQKGFMTVLAMVMMGIMLLLLFSLTTVKTADNQMKLVYYDGIKARYLAEAGAKKAYMKISNDEYFRQQLKINHAAINLNSAKQEFNNGLYEVAVKYNNEKFEIYAKGTCETAQRQIILWIEELDNNDYKIITWKNC